MRTIALTVSLLLFLFLFVACAGDAADSASKVQPGEAGAAAPEEKAPPKPPELPHEPKGQAIQGLPYIAYLAQPVFSTPGDSTSAVKSYRYCADYDDKKQPRNAIVIQPENTWSGNLIVYDKGEMNVMAYKDMRSPDKQRYFFKDIGKSWKYGGKQIEINIKLNESYGDLLTVQVTKLGATKVLNKQVYIHSGKLANYAPGDCN